jgi:hypothetical protein
MINILNMGPKATPKTISENGEKSSTWSPPKGKPLANKFASPSKVKIGGNTGTGKNRLHIEAFEGGILLGYFDNGSNLTIAAYNKPHFAKLNADDSLLETINVNDIVLRRGTDGITALPGKPNAIWSWQGLISIIGVENIHNTQFKQSHFVMPVLEYFNNFDELRDEYTFNRFTRFFEDHTQHPPRKISTALLDEKVLYLMLAAYSDNSGELTLGDLAEYDDIVSVYWYDMEYGKNAMRLASLARIH